jgi:ribose transport system substrate-binding protein
MVKQGKKKSPGGAPLGTYLVGAALVLVLGVALAACGGGSSSSSSGSTESSSEPASSEPAADTGSSGSSSLADFEKKVDEVVAERSGPQTEGPPKSGPKATSGKSVYIIACSQALEGCQRESQTAKEAGEAMGWKMTLYDTESKPDKMVEGIQRAIDNHANGLVVQAIDMSALAAPLEKAKSAGASVVCFACVNSNEIASQVIPSEQSFYEDGYAIAAQMYKNTEGHPKILVISNKETGVIVKRLEGTQKFVEDCKAAGGDCEIIDEQFFLYSNLTTAIPELVSVSLQQHPDINAVWMGFDSSEEFIQQGVEQAGASKEDIGLYGFDGNKSNIADIREGGWEVATMAGPFEWVGWAEIDALNRVFNGEEPVENVVKAKLITNENAPESDIYDGDGVDFEKEYEKVWGVG